MYVSCDEMRTSRSLDTGVDMTGQKYMIDYTGE